jgi:hypothetical protein
MSATPHNQTRITGTGEQQVFTGRGVLVALIPEATTTGTITCRDGQAGTATAFHTAATGLTQSGKQFGQHGVLVPDGLTVQLSAGTDAVTVVWEPKP